MIFLKKAKKCLKISLVLCIQQGHVETVKFLFEKGAKVDRVGNFGKTLLWMTAQV